MALVMIGRADLLHVGVVDDDAVDRLACQRVLRRISAVGQISLWSGVDAALAGRAVDLLLLDLNMPGRGGLDLLAAMPPGFARACVILLGTPITDALHQRLGAYPLVAGMVGKPLRAAALAPVLHDLMPKSDARADISARASISVRDGSRRSFQARC